MKQGLFIVCIVSMILSSSITLAADIIPTDIYSEDTISEEIDYQQWHFYKIDVDKPSKLTIKLRKISDDADLYVSRSKIPTEEKFQCAPLKNGTSIETCRLTSHKPGIWYIGIYGKMEGDYQLGVKTVDLKMLSQISAF
ncbi:MAG: PPC domain-containing protein [Gammaproteobacteria bacterium]|nr:PPC domain-containing protein [Gammaproteobacteria bacterium]